MPLQNLEMGIYVDSVTVDSRYDGGLEMQMKLKGFDVDSFEHLYYISEGNSLFRFNNKAFGFVKIEPGEINPLALKKSIDRKHKISDLILAEITKLKLGNYELSQRVKTIDLGWRDFFDFVNQEKLEKIDDNIWDKIICWNNFSVLNYKNQERYIGLRE